MVRYILIPLAITVLMGCRQQGTGTRSDAGGGAVGSAASDTGVEDPVKARFAAMEADALKSPYKGIFAPGGTAEGLFSIRQTGVSTEPIVESARAFLGSLDPEQRRRLTFGVEDQEWRKWSNVDNGIYDRQGVSLKEMDSARKALAFDLMAASLSAKGLRLSRDIMKTDQTLKELNNGSDAFDEELYFFTLMGEPSETEPWGWQLDGHHLVINYFVLGDQVVMSPVFMGAEPVVTTTGKYAGNTLFQDEQNLGLALMRSLRPEQQSRAVVSEDKVKENNVAAANRDNLTLEFQGIPAADLTPGQQQQLLDLIDHYVSNMREGHRQVRMEEVAAHLDDTWFSWVGEQSEDAVFYYRIHSPVILIEFDHQRVVGVPGPNDGLPTRNHIHTVVRTPNGNDYGKDLLRQHKERHHSH